MGLWRENLVVGPPKSNVLCYFIDFREFIIKGKEKKYILRVPSFSCNKNSLGGYINFILVTFRRDNILIVFRLGSVQTHQHPNKHFRNTKC